MFIDKDEIEEMLGEYYDFSNVSESQWQKIDKEVEQICKARGVDSEEDYDTYSAICDGCVGRVLSRVD